MKEQEFIDFLKNNQEALFDEKRFRGLMSDYFPDNGQMNHILCNLFHMNLPRDIAEAESVDNSIFFKYKKTVVKQFGTDQSLAEEAVRLWIVCYGKGVLNKKIDISALPGITNEGKNTDFSGSPFALSIPDTTVAEGVAIVSFKILSKRGISVDVVVEGLIIKDKLKKEYKKGFKNLGKTKDEQTKYIEADIPIKGKDFLISESSLCIWILCGDEKRYKIIYKNERSKGFFLKSVSYDTFTEKNKQTFYHAIGNLDIEAAPKEERADNDSKIPQIEEYLNAVLREKYFLQNEGGRKHKVTNGKRINSKNGISTYSFEMESELNLSDDAPITVTVGGIKATGSVILCEGFELVVSIDLDFGDTVSQAFIGVEPWKLLEALVDRLRDIKMSDTIALDLIGNGPTLASKGKIDSIPKGQEEALELVDNEDISVIWGPPGTGKTYTMAKIAVDAIDRGESILVVSHSNVSVDGVVKATVDQLREAGMSDVIEAGKVLRFGYVRDDELSQDEYAVAYNYALNKDPNQKLQIESLTKERDRLKHEGKDNTPEYEKVVTELKSRRSAVRALERGLAKNAQYLATTISKVTIDKNLFDEKYDIVMFDEVSMAYVPQIICAASFARKKLVLVGDFRQLAPIVQSDAKSALGVDIFSYLGISSGKDVNFHPWLAMLNEQRRMHPLISAFPNKFIYHNLLKDHDSVTKSRLDVIAKEPLKGKSINLIDLAGSYCAAMKNNDNSRFNILSAIVCFKTALSAEANGEESIGIITPYAAQTRIIRAMIQDYRSKYETNITCSTVHQFQGSERNLIIFDAVESYPFVKTGFLMSKDADSVNRLINVAITRTRGKLIVVANTKFWENRFAGTDHILYRLITYLKNNGRVIKAAGKGLNDYLKTMPNTRGITLYDTITDCLEKFKSDIDKAKGKIVISIPDGKLDPEAEIIVMKSIESAKQRGVRVLSKTNGYVDMPASWKNITWASENAIFPLIIIDDKIAWYDVPKSRGQFNDKNNGYMTICHLYYRITGEHTIEMIKANSDFEIKVITENNRASRGPLLERNGQTDTGVSIGADNDTGKGAAGLDAFIRKKEFCPTCKSPMTLTKGRSGKCYLKCSSSKCKETKLLEPDMVKWYLSQGKVKCPKCGSLVTSAGLGRYGVFARCENGDYINPDMI